MRMNFRPESRSLDQHSNLNQALSLLRQDTRELVDAAGCLRDEGHGNLITYSRKVFVPLTQLCRDVCHYCTFAKTPKQLDAPYLPIERIVDVARRGRDLGCREVLFTLGEKPELRYRAAREALAKMGYSTTLEYLRDAAERVYEESGLLPHLNPGTMTADELRMLRPVAPSMGIMLESASHRLSEKGMPHYGSPDKEPALRLATIESAGRARIPCTSGILIGIGESRRERIDALLKLKDLHDEYGHLQEIIVQNFRAKGGTKMADSPEPDLDELVWTIAVTRLMFGPSMSIQAPPNLSPGALRRIIEAGANDWGGVSPLTPDFVNPEAPWPHLDELARETAFVGKYLRERLTIYPEYARKATEWTDKRWHTPLQRLIDAVGLPRTDDWTPGSSVSPPKLRRHTSKHPPVSVSPDVIAILAKAQDEVGLEENEIVRLFNTHGDEFVSVVAAADDLRRDVNGDNVSYAVNRNINYTNICYFHCKFCAFSKGKGSKDLRGAPYDLSIDEIQRRTREAWQRGATEICMLGGISPNYTGETYLTILRAVKDAAPDIHVHSFSPLEVWQGAKTLHIGLADYLQQLKAAGLSSLPGTAAEILDEEIRQILCADKVSTDEWLEVMETAHRIGLRSTATIMFGHVDHPVNWARHLLCIRDLQARTGGFTEFVPLPFVHMEAPIYRRGMARKGPTWRESILMHAVARLSLHPQITNIQTSWVKMGIDGAIACLQGGCNDLGGTLMNESISRAAGASHGQELSPARMRDLITGIGRQPSQRDTFYGEVAQERIHAGLHAEPCCEIRNTPIARHALKKHGAVAGIAAETSG